MIPGGTPNQPLRRVVDTPFTSKSHFGLLAVRCLSFLFLLKKSFLAYRSPSNPLANFNAQYKKVVTVLKGHKVYILGTSMLT